MITTLKHAPYKGSTKAILSQLKKVGDTFIAESSKQAMALHTVGKSHGMMISRAKLSNGQFQIVRLR